MSCRPMTPTEVAAGRYGGVDGGADPGEPPRELRTITEVEGVEVYFTLRHTLSGDRFRAPRRNAGVRLVAPVPYVLFGWSNRSPSPLRARNRPAPAAWTRT